MINILVKVSGSSLLKVAHSLDIVSVSHTNSMIVILKDQHTRANHKSQ